MFIALRRVLVLRGAYFFTILLVLLKKKENDFSASFSLIGLSQSIWLRS